MYNQISDTSVSHELDRAMRDAILTGLPEPLAFGAQENLLSLGLDSLRIMRIVSRFRKQGYAVTFSEFMEKPRLQDWVALLAAKIPEDTKLKEAVPKITAEEAFALTDVQYAYWVGRGDDQILGGVGCHACLELDGNGVAPDRLTAAWEKINAHHPMLRAKFSADGRQQIQPVHNNGSVAVHDFRALDADAAGSKLDAIRERLSHHYFDVENGRVAGLELSLLPGGETRIHFNIDLLVSDVLSLNIVLRDLASAYAGTFDLPAPGDDWFARYLQGRIYEQAGDKHQAREYWNDRLASLPGPPGLPLEQKPESITAPRFKRRQYIMEKEGWQNLQQRAASHGVTPAMVLLTAYAEILNQWSSNVRFLINIPLFDRETSEAGMENMVSDFTSLLLLAVDFCTPLSFIERVNTIQSQCHRDVTHSAYSGIEVQRDLARMHNGETMFAPVVFASNLGNEFIPPECADTLGRLGYMLSQTPQVWLDFQLYEIGGSLLLAWDAVDDLFPGKMLDDMFGSYCALAELLAFEASAWNQTGLGLVPGYQIQTRSRVNHTEAPVSGELLHTLFEKKAAEQQDHPAVISGEAVMNYGTLDRYAGSLGAELVDRGARPNTLIAIVMEKGVEMVVAVLGILKSGAAYLPIDPDVPNDRLTYLLTNSRVDIVLTQSWLAARYDLPEETQMLCVDTLDPDRDAPAANAPYQTPEDLAYVIYTSGSTGLPKGVMINHLGAVNTILDLNARFEVTPEDRVLALANLNFDLSVYDIFGILGAGGTIVLPEPGSHQNPASWFRLVRANGITIWNTVPAVMQMFVEYLESEGPGGDALAGGESLDLVMLSGDWVPLDLPGKIQAQLKPSRLMSLGGATEASIWSNLFRVDGVDPAWKSIPYGTPMVNQQEYVLDEYMRACPEWVTGDLYIGGIGLAMGYWQDRKKTDAAFITHPETGERLYKTGDLARCLPDGNIEFMGRKDSQVKIRGYRIELGEIESVLTASGVVDKAVVLPEGKTSNNLGAAIVADAGATFSPGELKTWLHRYLGAKLPRYMIPGKFLFLESLPLNPNGKVDRKAIKQQLDGFKDRTAREAPEGFFEKEVEKAWCEVLEIEGASRHDDFFQNGGDSLKAARLIRKLNKTGLSSEDISIRILFANSTIAKLANQICMDTADETEKIDEDKLVEGVI